MAFENDLRHHFFQEEKAINRHNVLNLCDMTTHYIGNETFNEGTPDIFTHHKLDIHASFVFDSKEQHLTFTSKDDVQSNRLVLKHDNGISTDDWLNSLNLSDQERQTMLLIIDLIQDEAHTLGDVLLIDRHTPMERAINNIKSEFQVSPIDVKVSEVDGLDVVNASCTINYKDMEFVVPMSNLDETVYVDDFLSLQSHLMSKDVFRLFNKCSNDYSASGVYSVLYGDNPHADMFDGSDPINYPDSNLAQLNNLEVRALYQVFEDVVQHIKDNELNIMKRLPEIKAEQELSNTHASMKLS